MLFLRIVLDLQVNILGATGDNRLTECNTIYIILDIGAIDLEFAKYSVAVLDNHSHTNIEKTTDAHPKNCLNHKYLLPPQDDYNIKLSSIIVT
jgi:hypothetical protein